jgi:putative ABC transport system permease protein
VGDTIPLFVNRTDVQVRIVGKFELFPGYIPQPMDDHLLLTDLDRMLAKANRASGGAEPGFTNEVWVRDATNGATTTSLRARNINADRVVSLRELRAAQQRDPLVAASWEGILFISFAAVLLLTALGFIVYSYLSAQARSLEFAILRTMGFSGRQIAALVSFEQAFVILAGTIAGTVLGLPLGRLMIGYMGVTETGEQVIPPLVSRVSWQTVAIADGVLAAIFLVTIAVLVLLYSRLAVHRALRMGEL